VIAAWLAMTDENYTALLLWTICMLVLACGVVALTQHPDWFGA
jgi:inner membrane protein involved in colicin E2 resistance